MLGIWLSLGFGAVITGDRIRDRLLFVLEYEGVKISFVER